MTRKGWMRLAGAAVLTSGLAAGWSSPGSVHAFSLAGPCHNLDPVTTHGALFAFANNARPWDQIQSVSTTAGPTLTVNAGDFGGAAVSVQQLQITLTTCAAAKPSFPIASVAGTVADTGAQYTACLKLDPSEPIVSSPNGIVDDQLLHEVEPGAQDLFTGPFPANQGWRFCAFASINAAEADDSGVSIFDPIGVYDEFDQVSMCDNASNLGFGLCNPTFTKAAYSVVGGFFTVTLSMPYKVVVSTLAPPTDPGNGNGNITTIDPWIKTGDTLSDLVAVASAANSAAIPSAIGGELCDPALGCVQGIAALLATVDWLPGYEVCSTPVVGCSKMPGSGLDLGLLPLNYQIGATRTPVNAALATPPNGVTNGCLTPIAAGLTSCMAVNTASGPNGIPADYVFDYGRTPYGTVPATGAALNTDPSHADYTLTFQYQDYAGDTFTA